MIKKADIIIAVSVIIAALVVLGAFFLFSLAGGYVVVVQEGKEVARLPLDKDDSIAITHDALGHNTVVVKDGKVSVAQADCRDQICVKHKPVKNKGETIVCLPHKLIVEIKK